jgi:leucyl-tRNA synthetase
MMTAFSSKTEIEIVLQVNGKVRDRITVALDATSEQLETWRANEKVRNAVIARRFAFVVPNKLVNIVAA